MEAGRPMTFLAGVLVGVIIGVVGMVAWALWDDE